MQKKSAFARRLRVTLSVRAAAVIRDGRSFVARSVKI